MERTNGGIHCSNWSIRQHPLGGARAREVTTIHGLFMIIADGKCMNLSKYLQVRRKVKFMIFECRAFDFAMYINIRELSATGSKYYDHKTLDFCFSRKWLHRDGRLTLDLRIKSLSGVTLKLSIWYYLWPRDQVGVQLEDTVTGYTVNILQGWEYGPTYKAFTMYWPFTPNKH